MQGWWEHRIIGTVGVQAWEFRAGMLGTFHNGHSKCKDPGTATKGWWEPLKIGTVVVQTWKFSALMVGGNPLNGYSKCKDPGTST